MKNNQNNDDGSIIAGRKPVQEMLLGSPERIDTLFLQKGRQDKNFERTIQRCKKNKIRYRITDRDEMNRLFDGNHQGVIARIAALPFADLDDLLDNLADAPLPLLVFLDRVQDTGNIGVFCRTLYSLGGAGIVVGKHGGGFLGAAAMKTSAGALSKLPVARVVNLAQALDKVEERGINIYGAALNESSESVYEAELFGPAVLVLGNEESGIRPGIMKRCQKQLHIPFRRDFDSLNVAQAGAILVSEFARKL